MNVRVKDIDLERRALTVRGRKGDKDRVSIMPESLVEGLRVQLEGCRSIYECDLEEWSSDIRTTEIYTYVAT